MTNKKNENKNIITERVFRNEQTTSLESILTKYLNAKVENLITERYASDEVKAISNENKEVA